MTSISAYCFDYRISQQSHAHSLFFKWSATAGSEGSRRFRKSYSYLGAFKVVTFALDVLRAEEQFSYMKISLSCEYELFQSTAILGFLALVVITFLVKVILLFNHRL